MNSDLQKVTKWISKIYRGVSVARWQIPPCSTLCLPRQFHCSLHNQTLHIRNVQPEGWELDGHS